MPNAYRITVLIALIAIVVIRLPWQQTSIQLQGIHFLGRPRVRSERPKSREAVAKNGWLPNDMSTVYVLEDGDREALREAASREGPFMLKTENLERLAAEWKRELIHGSGLVRVKGFIFDDDQIQESAFSGLGHQLGLPVTQNDQGLLLAKIERADGPESHPFYRFDSELALHTDLVDLTALLCLQKPAAGGRSRIVSVMSALASLNDTAFNAVLDEMNFPLDARGQAGLDYVNVPALGWTRENKLLNFWHSDYFRSGLSKLQNSANIQRLSDLMDLVESQLNRPDLILSFALEPGDLLFFNNHLVMHGREAYQEYPQGPKRQLLRLWLSFRPDDAFSFFGFNHKDDEASSSHRLFLRFLRNSKRRLSFVRQRLAIFSSIAASKYRVTFPPS